MRLALNLAALSALNMVIAFAFQVYAVTALGAGAQTDALFAGMAIPTLVLTIISGSVMHVLVPLLTGQEGQSAREDAWTLVAVITGIFLALFAGFYVSAPVWVPLLVPGFDLPSQLLTLELTRIQLIGMTFTAINGVQWAVYHSRQQFLWAELAPGLAAAVAFVCLIYLLPIYGIQAVAWLSVARVILQTALLSPSLGWPVRPNLKSRAVKESWSRIKPLLLGSAYYKTDILVDRVLLSISSAGSLTLFYLAQRIYAAGGQIFNQALCAPAVPVLSSLFKLGEFDKLKYEFRKKLMQIALLGAALLLMLFVLGRPALELVLGYGAFDDQSVATLWFILIWLGGMFFGSGTGQLCASTFYAMGDTRTPTKLSIITYTLYIPAKILSFWVWGIKGLALATSVYFLGNFLLQFYLLERRFKNERY